MLLAVIGPLLVAARACRVPASLVLFAAGLLASFIPGLPPIQVEPDLVTGLFLPPILYASTVRVSWHLLRFTFVPGIILGAAMALVSIGAVACAARFVFLPGLPWTAALLLGAVLSIFDTRLFHEAKARPRVPRAIADTLKARELTGRIVILATFSLVLEAASAGRISVVGGLEHYLFDIPAGVLLGMAVGRIVVWARERIDPAPVEIAVSVATPYAAALSAAALGVSAVAAITSAALVVSALRIDRVTGAPISSSEARISATAFWEEVSLMVSSALFFLAGRALPEALGAIESWRPFRLAICVAGLLAVLVAVHFAFSFLATGMRPLAAALADRRGERVRAKAAGVMAWSSTRSVIGLVLALSIPAALPGGSPFPARDLILVAAALTIVGSVLVQGFTLRAAVGWFDLGDAGGDDREEEAARQAMENAARAPRGEHANGFDAARQALLAMRERDEIGDEVLTRMLRETDLTSRAAEGDALPGAGPPNP